MANHRTNQLFLLFPAVRGEVLRLLFARPNAEHYERELAQLSFLALGTVQRELRLLVSAGLLIRTARNARCYYRANPKHPLHLILRRLAKRALTLPFQKPLRPAHKRRVSTMRPPPQIRGRIPTPWRRPRIA